MLRDRQAMTKVINIVRIWANFQHEMITQKKWFFFEFKGLLRYFQGIFHQHRHSRNEFHIQTHCIRYFHLVHHRNIHHHH